MGLGTGIMRSIVIFFNSLFLIGGLGGLAGGIWMAVSPSKLFKFIKYTFEGSDEFVRNASYVLIGVSCFIILVAALGCYGACARNRCLLGVYAGMMVIILILQIAAIVMVIVFDQKFTDDAKDAAAKLLKKTYNDTAKQEFTDAVDSIQKEFECCGVRGQVDFAPNSPPASCSGNEDKGCYDAIRNWVKRNLGVVIGITVAVILFQVILFVFATCLCRNSDFDKIV